MQNNIFKTYLSSAAQQSTSWCSFAGIFYIFNVCNISLRLEELQCATIKNSWKFLLRHTCVDKFAFIGLAFEKKEFPIVKSQSALFLEV